MAAQMHPNPALPAPRTSLEAPRPRHALRPSNYILRSSPLAGPAITTSRHSMDDACPVDENDTSVDTEKTRTGATPSRILTLYPTPPPSLRSFSLSRTPSPTRSEVSAQSSACSATTFSTSPLPVISSPTPLGSRPRTRSQALLPTDRRSPSFTSISRSGPFEYPASAAPFSSTTSPDAARNWLTKTAPPPFSRTRVKSVVMPVKASAKRPQTAPSIIGARTLDSRAASTLPQGKRDWRMGPISLNEETFEYRNVSSVGNAARSRNSSFGASVTRKQRRPRSLMSFSSRPTLGEVREEHEREGESEAGGEGESGMERTVQGDGPSAEELPVIFPLSAIKDGPGSPSAAAAQREPKNGWMRRWKTSLKRFKNRL